MHLAELIQDEMRTRNWSLDDLVMNMGPHQSEHDWGICKLSWEFFFGVPDPGVILGAVMAQQLEDAFDVPASFFVAIHEMWRQEAKSCDHTYEPVEDGAPLCSKCGRVSQ